MIEQLPLYLVSVNIVVNQMVHNFVFVVESKKPAGVTQTTKKKGRGGGGETAACKC